MGTSVRPQSERGPLPTYSVSALSKQHKADKLKCRPAWVLEGQPVQSALSGAYVEAVHRGLGAVLDYELDRVGGLGDGVFYDRVHPREHVVRDRDPCGRAPDTDAPPDEVIAQSPYDGTQAVVPARTASDLDAHRPCFQVEVVVDDDEVFGPVVRDGGARVVHEGRRLEEGGVFQAKGDGGCFGLLPLAPGAVVTLCELVGDQVAGVMAGGVGGAGRGVRGADQRGAGPPPLPP